MEKLHYLLLESAAYKMKRERGEVPFVGTTARLEEMEEPKSHRPLPHPPILLPSTITRQKREQAQTISQVIHDTFSPAAVTEHHTTTEANTGLDALTICRCGTPALSDNDSASAAPTPLITPDLVEVPAEPVKDYPSRHHRLRSASTNSRPSETGGGGGRFARTVKAIKAQLFPAKSKPPTTKVETQRDVATPTKEFNAKSRTWLGFKPAITPPKIKYDVSPQTKWMVARVAKPKPCKLAVADEETELRCARSALLTLS
jgi:hypothetical protein